MSVFYSVSDVLGFFCCCSSSIVFSITTLHQALILRRMTPKSPTFFSLLKKFLNYFILYIFMKILDINVEYLNKFC